MSRQLFKSTVVVSSMTLISRILGFVRDMLIARIFGVDLATDAFLSPLKSLIFCDVYLQKAHFAHAFVPVLADYKAQGSKAALKLFIDKTAGTLALLLMLITLMPVS